MAAPSTLHALVALADAGAEPAKISTVSSPPSPYPLVGRIGIGKDMTAGLAKVDSLRTRARVPKKSRGCEDLDIRYHASWIGQNRQGDSKASRAEAPMAVRKEDCRRRFHSAVLEDF